MNEDSQGIAGMDGFQPIPYPTPTDFVSPESQILDAFNMFIMTLFCFKHPTD